MPLDGNKHHHHYHYCKGCACYFLTFVWNAKMVIARTTTYKTKTKLKNDSNYICKTEKPVYGIRQVFFKKRLRLYRINKSHLIKEKLTAVIPTAIKTSSLSYTLKGTKQKYTQLMTCPKYII